MATCHEKSRLLLSFFPFFSRAHTRKSQWVVTVTKYRSTIAAAAAHYIHTLLHTMLHIASRPHAYQTGGLSSHNHIATEGVSNYFSIKPKNESMLWLNWWLGFGTVRVIHQLWPRQTRNRRRGHNWILCPAGVCALAGDAQLEMPADLKYDLDHQQHHQKNWIRDASLCCYPCYTSH